MSIIITGDLDWSGALVLFLTALDGGPAADVAGYAFTSSGDVEYSAEVPEPGLPANRLLGVYRCVAKTAGDVIAGSGYVTIAAGTEAVRIRGEQGAESSGLPVDQVAQLQRIEALASRLSGTPVNVNGNVKPGGQIVLKHGDNHLVSLLNSVPVPVDDVGGSLHILMASIGTNNIGVAAIRGADPASRILGTVAALNYASNLLTVTMEFTAAETSKGVVGPVYTYDVYRLNNPTHTFFSGKLTVTRDARP